MSLAGSSERIGFLRKTLARIEAQAGPAQALPAPAATQVVWQPHHFSRIALGTQNFSLDRVLGGGLQIGALHDIAVNHASTGSSCSACPVEMGPPFGRA